MTDIFDLEQHIAEHAEESEDVVPDDAPSEEPYVKPTWDGPPPALAKCEDIMDRWRETHRSVGLVGEERLKEVIFLAINSRHLPWENGSRPTSVKAEGASSSGKSHTTEGVIKFFPPDAVIDLTSASPKFLFYDQRSYVHRFIYIGEYSAIKDDDQILTALRELLSAGRIAHGSVATDRKRPEGFIVEKKGPTGLLVTTTQASVHPELETRLLGIRTDDTPKQTRAVMETIADVHLNGRGRFDYSPWHDLQRWIEAQDNVVVVPYARELALALPDGAVRLRRDYTTILSLVQSHAILHQGTRRRDSRNRIVATLDDYEAVRRCLSRTISEGIGMAVGDAIRELVAVVSELYDGEPLTIKEIDGKLGVGDAAIRDRLKRAVPEYLTDARPQGRGKWLVKPGGPLPERSEEDPLPPGEHLRRLRSSDTVQTRMVEPEKAKIAESSDVFAAPPSDEPKTTEDSPIFGENGLDTGIEGSPKTEDAEDGVLGLPDRNCFATGCENTVPDGQEYFCQAHSPRKITNR